MTKRTGRVQGRVQHRFKVVAVQGWFLLVAVLFLFHDDGQSVGQRSIVVDERGIN